MKARRKTRIASSQLRPLRANTRNAEKASVVCVSWDTLIWLVDCEPPQGIYWKMSNKGEACTIVEHLQKSLVSMTTTLHCCVSYP